VWLVGDWRQGEFDFVRGTLDGAARWPILATPDEAAAASLRPPPEVALVAQPRPGDWQQAAIVRLQAALPLARIVIVAGSWCEGERRTGRPLVAAARLYWHELPAWWGRALAHRAAGLAPHWSGTGDAALTGDQQSSPRAAPAAIAVDSIDHSVFETLADVLKPYGWRCVWTSRGRGEFGDAAVGVWDGGQLDPNDLADLERFCRRFAARPASVVALVDYPRVEHFELIARTGAAALLGKPYSVASLAYELQRLADSPPVGSIPRPATGRG
jgi:hypothetical protein